MFARNSDFILDASSEASRARRISSSACFRSVMSSTVNVIGPALLDGSSKEDLIRTSKRLLLTAVGRVENTGQVLKRAGAPEAADILEWSDFEKGDEQVFFELVSAGITPQIFEPITADIVLKCQSKKASMQPMHPETGKPLGKPVSLKSTGEGIALSIGPQYRTVWYEIVK